MPKAIKFNCSGRFAHFLKAEANASAPTYPVPPRTALLGLLGAVLGLAKDAPPTTLADCRLAVAGNCTFRHWHSANLRKDPPAALPWTVRSRSKGSSSSQRNTIIAQEWLVHPRYVVWALPPAQYSEELAARLRDKRWYFSPCLGLSEMLADLHFEGLHDAEPLLEGSHCVSGTIRRSEVQLDLKAACENGLAIETLRMPRDVSGWRAFVHEAYYRETHGKDVPVHTDAAWSIGNETVMWL